MPLQDMSREGVVETESGSSEDCYGDMPFLYHVDGFRGDEDEDAGLEGAFSGLAVVAGVSEGGGANGDAQPPRVPQDTGAGSDNAEGGYEGVGAPRGAGAEAPTLRKTAFSTKPACRCVAQRAHTPTAAAAARPHHVWGYLRCPGARVHARVSGVRAYDAISIPLCATPPPPPLQVITASSNCSRY